MLQPRVGFAYMLDDKTIMRGGYGIYYLNVVGISASDGFGVQTPPVTSLDGDRTSTSALSNPFPQRHLKAPGSSFGLSTNLGRSSASRITDFVNPYVHQFSSGFQRMLPWRMTFEASYVGSRTRALQNRWARLQRAVAGAARSLRSVEGRQSRDLQRAAAEPVLPDPGLRRHGAVHEPDAVAL